MLAGPVSKTYRSNGVARHLIDGPSIVTTSFYIVARLDSITIRWLSFSLFGPQWISLRQNATADSATCNVPVNGRMEGLRRDPHYSLARACSVVLLLISPSLVFHLPTSNLDFPPFHFIIFSTCLLFRSFIYHEPSTNLRPCSHSAPPPVSLVQPRVESS